MSSQPSPLSMPLPWNLVAPGYAAKSFDHFSKYSRDALRLAGVTAGERVLDVATGPGSLALQAATIAREVEAIDFSEQMLAQLHGRIGERGIANIAVREGDGQALPYADRTFDAAFSMFGLIFFPERARGFAELYRVLAPGGRAVVSSWQPMSKEPVLAELFGALAAELPHLQFGKDEGPLANPDDLRREMEAAGFRDVRVEPTEHVVESPDVDAFWADTRETTAPLVLLEHRLGREAFAPVAEGIVRRLRARFPGEVRVAMPAWLAIGVR